MRIGFTEFVVILIIVIALIKPDKLVEYAHTLGQVIRDFTNKKQDVENSIMSPIKEVIEPVNMIKNELNESLSDIDKVMKGEQKR